MTETEKVMLTVCTTCRRNGEIEEGEENEGFIRPGGRLLSALKDKDLPENVEIRGVKCLSACKNGCTITLTGGPERWSYIYAHLDPVEHADDILAGVSAYATTQDGLVPWRDRPVIFRKQSIARIPPVNYEE